MERFGWTEEELKYHNTKARITRILQQMEVEAQVEKIDKMKHGSASSAPGARAARIPRTRSRSHYGRR